jgi:hypothetical protein
MNPRQFIIDWNNRYPLDRWYRNKHNLRFGCEEHLEMNFLDMYFEWLEDKLYAEAEDKLTTSRKKNLQYKKNGFLEERILEVPEDLFENIDYSLFDEK